MRRFVLAFVAVSACIVPPLDSLGPAACDEAQGHGCPSGQRCVNNLCQSGEAGGAGGGTAGGGSAGGMAGGSAGGVAGGTAGGTAGGAAGGSAGGAAGGSAGGLAVDLDGGNDAGIRTDAGPNFAFVTSVPITGGFGGYDNAEQFCRKLAADAGLPGVFRAWVSTDDTPAARRLSGARGWVMPNGTLFADTLADLLQSRLYHSLAVDEWGNPQTGLAWTGTTFSGVPGSNCMNWTQTLGGTAIEGSTQRTSSAWMAHGQVSCQSAELLYCLGADRASAVHPPPPPTPSRRVFVSEIKVPITGLSGVTRFDMECRDEAAAAGLSGTYMALVPIGTSMPASSRFSSAGGPWFRVDGVLVNDDVFTTSPPQATIDVTADGGRLPASAMVWTGANTPSSTTTNAQSCSVWGGGSQMAILGRADTSSTAWFVVDAGFSCTDSQHVYCVQQ